MREARMAEDGHSKGRGAGEQEGEGSTGLHGGEVCSGIMAVNRWVSNAGFPVHGRGFSSMISEGWELPVCLSVLIAYNSVSSLSIIVLCDGFLYKQSRLKISN